MKRFLGLLLVFILTMSLLYGCGTVVDESQSSSVSEVQSEVGNEVVSDVEDDVETVDYISEEVEVPPSETESVSEVDDVSDDVVDDTQSEESTYNEDYLVDYKDAGIFTTDLFGDTMEYYTFFTKPFEGYYSGAILFSNLTEEALDFYVSMSLTDSDGVVLDTQEAFCHIETGDLGGLTVANFYIYTDKELSYVDVGVSLSVSEVYWGDVSVSAEIVDSSVVGTATNNGTTDSKVVSVALLAFDLSGSFIDCTYAYLGGDDYVLSAGESSDFSESIADWDGCYCIMALD